MGLGTWCERPGCRPASSPRHIVKRLRGINGDALHHDAPADAGIVLVDFEGDFRSGRIRQLATRRCSKRDYPAAHCIVDRKDLGLPVDDDGNPTEAVLTKDFQALRLRNLFQLSHRLICFHATFCLSGGSLSIGLKLAPGDLIGPDADPVLARSRRHWSDRPEAHSPGRRTARVGYVVSDSFYQ